MATPKNKSYKNYGAKGVKCIIDRNDFCEIYQRVENCQVCGIKFSTNGNDSNGKTVDRINCDGHYEKSNIRIVCKSCNNKNRPDITNSDTVELIRSLYCRGSMTHGTVALAKRFGVSQATVWSIVNYRTRCSP